MEEHRKNPAVQSCHRVIDPLGLALDNFDVTGAWRIKDNEAAGRLGRRSLRRHQDGRPGRAAARRSLKHSDVLLRSFTENLMTYALGRRVEYSGHAGDSRDRRATPAKNDNRFSSFVLGVVNSAGVPDGEREPAPSEHVSHTDVAAKSAAR